HGCASCGDKVRGTSRILNRSVPGAARNGIPPLARRQSGTAVGRGRRSSETGVSKRRAAVQYRCPLARVTEVPMTLSQRLFALAAILASPALLPAAEPDAAVKVEKNVVYGTAGGEKLYLDIAIPPGDGPFPCLVMFHGGAWTGGSRKDLSAGGLDKSGNPTPSWIEV